MEAEISHENEKIYLVIKRNGREYKIQIRESEFSKGDVILVATDIFWSFDGDSQWVTIEEEE